MSFIDQQIKEQRDHNKQTRQNIKTVKALLETKPPIDVLLQQLRNMSNQTLYINNSLTVKTVIMGLITLCIGIIFTSFSIWAISLILFAFCMLLFGYSVYTPSTELNALFDELNNYCLENKYNFKFYSEQDLEQHKHIETNFPLFKLGSQKNNIHFLFNGQWHIQEHTYAYSVFDYQYVNREMVRVAKDKWELKDVQRCLWGIFLENFPVRGISISTQQKKLCRLGVEWQSSDIRFNQSFQQSGIDEFELARFLSPERLLYLEKILHQFSGDFYVHPKTATLCWIFDVDLSQIESDLYEVNTVADLADQLAKIRMPNFEKFADALKHLIIETPRRSSRFRSDIYKVSSSSSYSSNA